MRSILSILLLFAISLFSFAQTPSEVSLIVVGEGATKEEATNNALRSAVEQTFGVFVSANTEILNDELVKDDIATISSGNIKSYTENAYYLREDGVAVVTLTVIVSINKLVSYTSNHGHTTEFAGSTFGANMRLYELNQQSTARALANLYKELSHMLPSMYDYKLTVKDPVIKGDNGIVQMTVDVLANENTKIIGDYFFNTVSALLHTDKELQSLAEMGNTFYGYYLHSFKKPRKGLSFAEINDPNNLYIKQDIALLGNKLGTKINVPDYMYYPLNKEVINSLFIAATVGFEIDDNIGNKYHFDLPETNYQAENRDTYFHFPEIVNTGVYSPYSTRYYRNNDSGVSLLSNAVFIGIIARNTDFNKGDHMYRLVEDVAINKDTIYKISSFSIEPNYHSGAVSVVKGLINQAPKEGVTILDAAAAIASISNFSDEEIRVLFKDYLK